MRTFFFIENYLHFMKNCIRPHYEKLKPLKSGFMENSNFENNRDPCLATQIQGPFHLAVQRKVCSKLLARKVNNGASVH